jgi:hypothetical protein
MASLTTTPDVRLKRFFIKFHSDDILNKGFLNSMQTNQHIVEYFGFLEDDNYYIYLEFDYILRVSTLMKLFRGYFNFQSLIIKKLPKEKKKLFNHVMVVALERDKLPFYFSRITTSLSDYFN